MCKNEIFLLSQKNLLRYYILLKYFKMYKKFGSTMLHILIPANHANVRDARIDIKADPTKQYKCTCNR